MGSPALEFELRPSAARRAVTAAIALLALIVAAAQALRLASPWPLLLLPVLGAAWWCMPERAPLRLVLDDGDIEAVMVEGKRHGTLAGRAAITAFAIDLPVDWRGGTREHLVIWRDAVDDASYRRLARTLRRLGP